MDVDMFVAASSDSQRHGASVNARPFTVKCHCVLRQVLRERHAEFGWWRRALRVCFEGIARDRSAWSAREAALCTHAAAAL